MATQNIKSAKCASNHDNKNYDNKDVEYKIYIIYNVNNQNYHASYTTQKYLSSVMANFQRKTNENMKNLFAGGCVRIDLLDVIITDNLFDVKQRIKELLKKMDGMSWDDINAQKFKEYWNDTKTVDTYIPPAYNTTETKEPEVKTEEPAVKTERRNKPKKQKPKELDFNGEIDLDDIDEFDPLPTKKSTKKPTTTKKETTKKETTKKEPTIKKTEKCKKPIWCQKCECEISYTNWSRHQTSKKHTA